MFWYNFKTDLLEGLREFLLKKNNIMAERV